MTTSTVQTHSGTRHYTSDQVMTEVAERYGREEIEDGCAAAIASWYQSTGHIGMPFTLLAQGSAVDLTDLLDSIAHERTMCVPEDERALDMLATWALNHDRDVVG
jgi:hypothetical protein